MTYLLAKYTVLFLLTALFGFVLGYWFSRRKFVDVSESYVDLRRANARSDSGQWEQLWNHLDSIPEPKETDLTAVYEQLTGIATSISNLPKPEPVSLVSLEDRLDSLQENVRGMPSRLIFKDPDFQPLIERLDDVERSVKAIPMPEKPTPVDFTAVSSKLDNLERTVKAIPKPEKTTVDLTAVTGKLQDLEQAVRNIPKPAPQRDVDLKPVHSELSSLRTALKAMPAVEVHKPVDLAPVTSKLNDLEQSFGSITRPQSVDLSPIDRRLTAIEAKLGKLGKRSATRSMTEPTPLKSGRSEPRILSAALYGKKDDLKLISGVGPKLEKLLNKNGVFYFWQVAEWSPQDINVIDERLDVFKGRIARDNWVTQAERLRRIPDAASMPAES